VNLAVYHELMFKQIGYKGEASPTPALAKFATVWLNMIFRKQASFVN
jgi:hypothetical protein